MAAGSNVVAMFRDGLRNIMSGRGTSVDKSTSSFWFHVPLDPGQVEAAFLSSWLIRKIVELPAEDMTREWRTWKLKEEEIKKIEAEERRLRVQEEILDGLVYGRLGGGIVVIGTDGDMSAEARDGEQLRYLKALPRRIVEVGPIDWSIGSENFGQPASFTINGAGSRDTVHHSRVMVFKGERHPRVIAIEGDEVFWGQPVVDVVNSAVKNVNTATDGFCGLIEEAKVDIFKLAGLADTLMQPDGQAKVTRRVEATNAGKSNWRGVYMDGDDEWQQRQINWTGMPDMIRTYLTVAAGAANIPATLLYGKAPDGQNSTGESDDRNYRSMIKTKQTRTLLPALGKIDRFLLPAAQVKADAEWEFKPLTTPTEKEQADIDDLRAKTAKTWDETGLIPRGALAIGAQSMLTEANTYPALAEELAKLPPEDLIPDDPADNPIDPSLLVTQAGRAALPAPRGGQQPAIKDAAPRSLYARRDVLNAAEIIRWAKKQGFTTTLPAGDMHVTLIWSRQPLDWMDVESTWGEGDDGSLTIKPGGARLVEPLGDEGAVCLLFNSSELSWRHEQIKRAGATHGHDEYQPHVTITYRKPAGLDLSKVEPFRGAIKLGPEIFEEVKDDWSGAPDEV